VLLTKTAVVLVLLVACGVAAAFFASRVPSSFLPDEDQGYAYINLQLPDGASLERTTAVAADVEKIILNTPGVKYATSVVGFSLLSYVRTSYSAFFSVALKPWDQRTTREQQFQSIKAHLNRELSKLPAGVAFSFSPPAIPGVGTSGGFTFMLEDRSGGDVQFLARNLNLFLAAARKRPEIASLSTTFLPNVPQEFIQVDRDKVLKQGVNLSDVYRTIQAFMGGYFINYFNRFGRQWQVYIEAEGEDRARVENVGQFYVRNGRGEAVPLSTLTTLKPRLGPEFTLRYNEYRSAQINGSAAPGYSADQATAALEEVFKQTMPREMGFDYLGISFLEQKARQGVPPAVIFSLSLLFVFLVLAALYESWSLPFSVLLSTPVAIFGAFGIPVVAARPAGRLPAPVPGPDGDRCLLANRTGHAHRPRGQERDSDRRVRQRPIRERKTSCGCRARRSQASSAADFDDLVRLHPWLRSAMDGQGAGSVARQIMGTTVIGGMLAASLIGIFFVPAIFYLVEKWSGAGKQPAPAALRERLCRRRETEMAEP
jgi:HAE1 family hydrophobic/amphiphilic exporter-1